MRSSEMFTLIDLCVWQITRDIILFKLYATESLYM